MASAGPPEAGISATEAEMIWTMTENIDLLYCADPPTPDWCQNLIRGDSGYNIGLEGSVLNVGTNLASGDLARELCAAVAAAHFDADAEPLGFTHVEVGGHTGEVIAECDIP